MIVLSRFHDPPSTVNALQIAWGAPPVTSTFISFPSYQYATKRLSGDQKAGNRAGAIGRAVVESMRRSHNRVFPLLSSPRKANVLPSGETLPSRNEVFSGGSMVKRAFGWAVLTSAGTRRAIAQPPIAEAIASTVAARASRGLGGAVDGGSCSMDQDSTSLRSRAVWNRSSGSLAIHFRSTRSRRG